MSPLEAYVIKLQQKQKAPPDYSGLNWTPATADAAFYRGILGGDQAAQAQPADLAQILSGQQASPDMGQGSAPSLLDMITGRPDAPIPTNNYTGPAPEPRQRPVKPDTYVIRKGDTLTSIAKRYGTTVKALAKKNGIKNVDRIKAGATLQL